MKQPRHAHAVAVSSFIGCCCQYNFVEISLYKIMSNVTDTTTVELFVNGKPKRGCPLRLKFA